MPATTTRPLSPRQQRFIASLATERVVPEMMQDAVSRAAAGVLPSSAASSLIETLLNARRQEGRRLSGNATTVPTPSNENRAGRMLNAGGIEATVTLPSGEHVTLQVRSRKPQGRGWTNCSPTEDGARITLRAFERKIGWVNVVDGEWRVSLRTRSDEARTAVTALFEHAAGQTMGLTVREASRCGRCMRTLTDPVSIDRGIGPECFGRSTGSRAATVTGESGAPTEADAGAFAEAALEAAEMMRREREHDAAFAAREREQERAAFASDPDFHTGPRVEVTLTDQPIPPLSLSTLAADAASPVLTREKQRARDLIAEALDAYCSDADRDFAMRTFDQLAAR